MSRQFFLNLLGIGEQFHTPEVSRRGIIETSNAERRYKQARLIIGHPIVLIILYLSLTALSGFGWLLTLGALAATDSAFNNVSGLGVSYWLIVMWLFMYIIFSVFLALRLIVNYKSLLIIFFTILNIAMTEVSSFFVSFQGLLPDTNALSGITAGFAILIAVDFIILILLAVDEDTLFGCIFQRHSRPRKVSNFFKNKWKMITSCCCRKDNREEEDLETV